MRPQHTPKMRKLYIKSTFFVSVEPPDTLRIFYKKYTTYGNGHLSQLGKCEKPVYIPGNTQGIPYVTS